MTTDDNNSRYRPTGLERAWWTRMASRVLTTLPSQARVLHVGADEPALVEELVALGVDAHGFQCSAPATPSHVAPERFAGGSLDEAGYADRSFSTVLWSLAWDAHPVGDAVRELLPALTRLCDRHAVVMFHRTDVRAVPTAYLEGLRGLFLTNGFRTHPLDLRFRTRDPRDDNDRRTLTLVFERMPDVAADPASGAASDDPALAAPDDPLAHDWLRNAHPNADEPAALFTLAARWISRQDVVVDVTPGAGCGAATLYDASSCARLVTMNEREDLISYARRAYSPHRPNLEFVCACGTQVAARIGDRAADVIVALDHRWTTTYGDALIEEASRALLPGGRLIIAIPAFTCPPSLTSEMFRRRFGRMHIEQVFARVPEGDGPRSLVKLTMTKFDDEASRFAVDYWIVVALNDPLAHREQSPWEIDHPRTHDASLNIAEVSDGYLNPWTPYGLVLGSRATSRDLLGQLALRTLDEHPAWSVDRGAALCVLAYRRLEGDESDAMGRAPLEAWLANFVAETPRTGVEIRWSISNSYVLARLQQRAGRLDDAESTYAHCAGLAARAHEASATIGPSYLELTGTKTVDAAFRSGWLAARRGDREQARQRWELGIATARQAVIGGWDRFTGPRVSSTPYALREAAQVLDAAARCEHGLAWLDLRDDRMAVDFAAGGLSLPIDVETPRLHVPPATFGERVTGGGLQSLLWSPAGARPVYVWGAGAMGQVFAAWVGGLFAGLTGFIDNDPAKEGSLVLGKPVYHSSRLEPGATQAVRPFVVVASSFAYQILPILERWGYAPDTDVLDLSAELKHLREHGLL